MLKGNRTRLFGILVIILGFLEGLQPEMLYAVVPPEHQWLITPVIGITIILLREITSTPAGRKD